MDHILEKESHIVIDIERCIGTSKEVGSPDPSNIRVENTVSIKVCSPPTSVDELINGVNSLKNVGEVSPNSGKNSKKEKHKSMSAKRPPKPPRPPRGFSLDAADQKLIKELSELAMIKRARIERMKELKKMKAAKASSVSASSGNLIPMLFTVLFCIVIIFQGCHSTRFPPRNGSDNGVPSSLEPREATEGNIILVQEQWNLSTPLTGVGSLNPLGLNPGLDGKYEEKKATK